MSTALSPQLKIAVREEVTNTLREFFDDPDFGLELSARAKRRLQLARRESGRRYSLAEMRRRHY